MNFTRKSLEESPHIHGIELELPKPKRIERSENFGSKWNKIFDICDMLPHQKKIYTQLDTFRIFLLMCMSYTISLTFLLYMYLFTFKSNCNYVSSLAFFTIHIYLVYKS